MEFKRKRDLVPTRKTLNPYGNYRGSREVDLSEKVCVFFSSGRQEHVLLQRRVLGALSDHLSDVF